MADDNSTDAFKIGYKRPPPHSRFRPGHSGNPRGKRKGLRNFATDAKAMLKAPVSLTEKGEAKRVSTQEAALLRLKEKALKGDARALEQVLRLAQIFNDEHLIDGAGTRDPASEDREILAAYAESLRLRASAPLKSDTAAGDGPPRASADG
jgi:hypothetical protein